LVANDDDNSGHVKGSGAGGSQSEADVFPTPDSYRLNPNRRPEDKKIFPVMKRVQGLLVAKGNPLNIISARDLTRSKIRFINRQKGSGTRLLFDTILAKEGIDAYSIKVYENEEFTHSAIATAILAKKADVGMGVKSIALENGLDFIQLKDEILFLAMNEDLSVNSDLAKLIRKIRVLSSASPGYKSIGLKRQIAGWL
jgi:molybdate-binding protein